MGFGAVWACRQGRVRGSLEALSGPREGSEGSGIHAGPCVSGVRGNSGL